MKTTLPKYTVSKAPHPIIFAMKLGCLTFKNNRYIVSVFIFQYFQCEIFNEAKLGCLVEYIRLPIEKAYSWKFSGHWHKNARG